MTQRSACLLQKLEGDSEGSENPEVKRARLLITLLGETNSRLPGAELVAWAGVQTCWGGGADPSSAPRIGRPSE